MINKPEVLKVCGTVINPHDIAAFESEEFNPKGASLGDTMSNKGKHRFRFLMKSGQEIRSEWMDDRCERGWRAKLQVLFDYIHPGEIEKWKIKNGFTGYLDLQGTSNKALKEAEEEERKKEERQKKFPFLKK